MVTVTPGSTPPELSETVPSMAPLAACDCAKAGAVSDSDSSAERKTLSILGVYNAKLERFGGLTVESKDLVSWIHFVEVLSHDDAARQKRSGEAMAGVAKSEQVVRKVAMRRRCTAVRSR